MTFQDTMDVVVTAFEVLGVAILAFGALLVFARVAMRVARGGRLSAYEGLRHELGRVILLGLEILIVADIIMTVTVSTTIESALSLGIIVLVRTFLSFSLDIELDGTLPWHRRDARAERAEHS